MKPKTKKCRSKKTPLTVKEILHLRSVNAETLNGMRKTFRAQAKMRQENPDIEPCWTCRGIAQKLGFVV